MHSCCGERAIIVMHGYALDMSASKVNQSSELRELKKPGDKDTNTPFFSLP